MAQGEFGESRGIMRIKRILWVLAAFVFASVLYAQRGPATGGPTATQTQQRTPGMPETEPETEPEKQAKTKAKKPEGPVPMTEKEVLKEIKNAPAEKVIKDVNDRGVDFDMTPSIEKKLRKANATDPVVVAVRQAGPKVRAQMAKLAIGPGPAGAQQIPKEEAQGFDAIKVELDPDKTIALANDFAKKYPNSPLLSYVYSFEANAYQQKGDVEKVVEYSGKGLKSKPDNLMSLILSIGMLPQPQYLDNHPADRDKILQEAEREANHALELIAQVPKQPNEADADYKKRQVELASEVHGPLGMIHLELATGALAGPDKAELAKAEQEFNTAVTTASHPDPRDYYRMGEAYGLDGKWDDAIQAFTRAGELGQGTMIKTYADQQIGEMKKRKAQGSAAPKS
jgi:tetratricopeptide (TPR) repeat protein